MKNAVFLIGFMGVGKTTVSDIIGERYSYHVLDLDESIVQADGRKISDIFHESGESYFRNLETEQLQCLPEFDRIIVSCGGGVVLRQKNVEIMRKKGRIVLLTAKPATILERVKTDDSRPILKDHMEESYIAELMEKRYDAYKNAADICVSTDGKTASEVADEVMKNIRRMEQ